MDPLQRSSWLGAVQQGPRRAVMRDMLRSPALHCKSVHRISSAGDSRVNGWSPGGCRAAPPSVRCEGGSHLKFRAIRSTPSVLQYKLE